MHIPQNNLKQSLWIENSTHSLVDAQMLLRLCSNDSCKARKYAANHTVSSASQFE